MRLLLMSAAFCVLAVTPLAAAAAPAPAKVQHWTVDKAASKLGFSTAFSGAAISGGFSAWTADINFDPKNLAASKATVTIDIASVSTGNAERDDILPSDDWFSTAKFKTATFTTTSIKDLGGGKYQAPGTLSLRGVTKPVTLNFTLTITGDTAKMAGTASINRSDFGVGQGQFKGADAVPFAVPVTVSLTAKKG
ncbi:MAG: polyisoprenoid-binding protein [Caulobacteraceae bacterium]|nr:polyisoprenoid-binding protein [Caulobacteraceae bacterium]